MVAKLLFFPYRSSFHRGSWHWGVGIARKFCLEVAEVAILYIRPSNSILFVHLGVGHEPIRILWFMSCQGFVAVAHLMLKLTLSTQKKIT